MHHFWHILIRFYLSGRTVTMEDNLVSVRAVNSLASVRDENSLASVRDVDNLASHRDVDSLASLRAVDSLASYRDVDSLVSHRAEGSLKDVDEESLASFSLPSFNLSLANNNNLLNNLSICSPRDKV